MLEQDDNTTIPTVDISSCRFPTVGNPTLHSITTDRVCMYDNEHKAQVAMDSPDRWGQARS